VKAGAIGTEEGGDPRHSNAAPETGNSEGGPSDGKPLTIGQYTEYDTDTG
jgi:hypothetical protein